MLMKKNASGEYEAVMYKKQHDIFNGDYELSITIDGNTTQVPMLEVSAEGIEKIIPFDLRIRVRDEKARIDNIVVSYKK